LELGTREKWDILKTKERGGNLLGDIIPTKRTRVVENFICEKNLRTFEKDVQKNKGITRRKIKMQQGQVGGSFQTTYRAKKKREG